MRDILSLVVIFVLQSGACSNKVYVAPKEVNNESKFSGEFDPEKMEIPQEIINRLMMGFESNTEDIETLNDRDPDGEVKIDFKIDEALLEAEDRVQLMDGDVDVLIQKSFLQIRHIIGRLRRKGLSEVGKAKQMKILKDTIKDMPVEIDNLISNYAGEKEQTFLKEVKSLLLGLDKVSENSMVNGIKMVVYKIGKVLQNLEMKS